MARFLYHSINGGSKSVFTSSKVLKRAPECRPIPQGTKRIQFSFKELIRKQPIFEESKKFLLLVVATHLNLKTAYSDSLPSTPATDRTILSTALTVTEKTGTACLFKTATSITPTADTVPSCTAFFFQNSFLLTLVRRFLIPNYMA